MHDSPADLLQDIISQSRPERRYRATLVGYNATTGEARIRSSAVDPAQTTTLVARVVPTLRMSAGALLQPGVNVVIEKLPGLPPYVMEVLDAEGSPLDGALTSPNQGSATGLGASSYKIPSDQLLLARIGASGISAGAVTAHAFDAAGYGGFAPGSAQDLSIRQWLKTVYNLTPLDGIIR